MPNTSKPRKRKKQPKYKSGWEVTVADLLKKLKQPVDYEGRQLTYTIPESLHKYTPDFPIRDDLVLEAKGKFTSQDRQKHILLKQQYPDVKICLVFQNANQRISKRSKTTYAMWCDKHGIPWSHKELRKEWFDKR